MGVGSFGIGEIFHGRGTVRGSAEPSGATDDRCRPRGTFFPGLVKCQLPRFGQKSRGGFTDCPPPARGRRLLFHAQVRFNCPGFIAHYIIPIPIVMQIGRCLACSTFLSHEGPIFRDFRGGVGGTVRIGPGHLYHVMPRAGELILEGASWLAAGCHQETDAQSQSSRTEHRTTRGRTRPVKAISKPGWGLRGSGISWQAALSSGF